MASNCGTTDGQIGWSLWISKAGSLYLLVWACSMQVSKAFMCTGKQCCTLLSSRGCTSPDILRGQSERCGLLTLSSQGHSLLSSNCSNERRKYKRRCHYEPSFSTPGSMVLGS